MQMYDRPEWIVCTWDVVWTSLARLREGNPYLEVVCEIIIPLLYVYAYSKSVL